MLGLLTGDVRCFECNCLLAFITKEQTMSALYVHYWADRELSAEDSHFFYCSATMEEEILIRRGLAPCRWVNLYRLVTQLGRFISLPT